jgi:hypothetical protein
MPSPNMAGSRRIKMMPAGMTPSEEMSTSSVTGDPR